MEVERPGELVGMDCFYVGRRRGTAGAIWRLTAIDLRSSYVWAELVICPERAPSRAQTSRLARRVAKDLRDAGWRLERVLCDNGQEFRSIDFGQTLERLGARRTHIHAGARKPTATLRHCTGQSSTSAGGRRSHVTSIRASPVCDASSRPISSSTTSTASITAA
jgi:hypothetical protein